MIRLAWRQVRLPAATTAALLTVLALVLWLTERAMTSEMDSSGLTACLSRNGDCTLASSVFMGRYAKLLGLVDWLNFVPMLAGLFWGAPLIAREIEQGTHRLAWTQSISRGRWLAVKLAMFLFGITLVAGILTVLFTWWFHPFARLDSDGSAFSRINPMVYDFQGTVLIAYTLYAFALGTAAGAIIRRTVPAMAVTVGGYLALRLPLMTQRGHLLAPLKISTPFTNPRIGLGDWVTGNTPIDKNGKPVSLSELLAACPGSGPQSGPRGTNLQCLLAHGYRLQETYQPLSRFWPLQGIETGIFLTASLLLLITAAWWTVYRVS